MESKESSEVEHDITHAQDDYVGNSSSTTKTHNNSQQPVTASPWTPAEISSSDPQTSPNFIPNPTHTLMPLDPILGPQAINPSSSEIWERTPSYGINPVENSGLVLLPVSTGQNASEISTRPPLVIGPGGPDRLPVQSGSGSPILGRPGSVISTRGPSQGSLTRISSQGM